MAESFRVWLVMANQNALDGFWAHRGEALPKPDEIIIVDNLLNPADVARARVTRVTPGGDPEIHATQIDEQQIGQSAAHASPHRRGTTSIDPSEEPSW